VMMEPATPRSHGLTAVAVVVASARTVHTRDS
jgi:hypothetical protein